MPITSSLPEPFQSYLQLQEQSWSASSCKRAKASLRHFCRFMEQQNIRLETLSLAQLADFSIYLKALGKNSPSSRLRNREAVRACLVRLSTDSVIQRDYRDWYPKYKYWPRMNLPVPKIAIDYLDLAATINKPNSRKRIQFKITRFHQFLKDQNISLVELRRSHMETFLKQLNNKGLAAATKVQAIVILRKYLHWLHDRDYLTEYPDKLLKAKDCPPIPVRLPRCLTLAVDTYVQTKLRQGNDIFYDALLLMRQTGIRVGELQNLEFTCLRQDHKGNFFLKVPLGKLNTERLVPLTRDMVELVRKIQKQSQCFSQNENPEYLIIGSRGRRASFDDFRSRMIEIQTELPPGTSTTSHQLRHTCATSLLNHGMSLVALKEFLGHKDIHMTLTYAAAAPETIRKEYLQAVESMQRHFQIKTEPLLLPGDADRNSLTTQVADLILKLKNAPDAQKKNHRNIIRSLKRVLLQINQS